jgi:hypothetical protein
MNTRKPFWSTSDSCSFDHLFWLNLNVNHLVATQSTLSHNLFITLFTTSRTMPPAGPITSSFTKRSAAAPGAVPILPIIFGLFFGFPALLWLIRWLQRPRTSISGLRGLHLISNRRRHGGPGTGDGLFTPLGQLAALAAITFGAIVKLSMRRMIGFLELLKSIQGALIKTLDFGCKGCFDGPPIYTERYNHEKAGICDLYLSLI